MQSYQRPYQTTKPSIATHDYYAKDEDDMMTSADVIANSYHDTFVIISLKTSAATFDIGTIRGTIKTKTRARCRPMTTAKQTSG